MGLLIGLVVRALVGGLLTIAGAGKLLSGSQQRRKWLQAYGLVPASSVPMVAVVVPSSELLAGTALLLGFGGRLSIALSGIVLFFVTGAAALTLARGRRPNCGCFGRWAREQLSWRTVARNVALVGLLALSGIYGLTDEPGIASLATATQILIVIAAAILVVCIPGAAARRSRTSRPATSLSPITEKA